MFDIYIIIKRIYELSDNASRSSRRNFGKELLPAGSPALCSGYSHQAIIHSWERSLMVKTF